MDQESHQETGRKAVKFYFKNPDIKTERGLWYVSHLHAKVWNIMLSICKGQFELVDSLLEKINIKGREEIQKLKDFHDMVPPAEKTYEHADGTATTVSFKPSRAISEFGMLYCLGPVRKNDPDLSALPVNDLQKPCRVLAKSFKSFFALAKKGDKEARPPRFKSAEFFFTLQWESPRVAEGKLLVNHKIEGLGEIAITLPRYVSELLADKKVRYATVRRKYPHVDRASNFEISLVYEVAVPEKILPCPETPVLEIAGIDFGARKVTLVKLSDPNTFKTWHLPKWDQWFTKERQKIEERMATKQKGSRAWIGLYDARTKLSKKWADKQKDLHRKIAHEMIQFADIFYVGKTDVRLGLAKSDGTKGQHRAVQNTGNLSRLIMFLKEKAAESGKHVIEVPDFKSDNKDGNHVRKTIAALRHLENGLQNHAVNEILVHI